MYTQKTVALWGENLGTQNKVEVWDIFYTIFGEYEKGKAVTLPH